MLTEQIVAERVYTPREVRRLFGWDKFALRDARKAGLEFEAFSDGVERITGRSLLRLLNPPVELEDAE